MFARRVEWAQALNSALKILCASVSFEMSSSDLKVFEVRKCSTLIFCLKCAHDDHFIHEICLNCFLCRWIASVVLRQILSKSFDKCYYCFPAHPSFEFYSDCEHSRRQSVKTTTTKNVYCRIRSSLLLLFYVIRYLYNAVIKFSSTLRK